MSGPAEGLANIRRRVAAACAHSGRAPEEVTLLAVSKTFPAESVEEAYREGQLDFGESRQQEAACKVPVLPDEIRWHFIGKLQRNKVRKVLPDFAVIHSIDSLRLATHVDRIAGELGLRPEIYLEVNLANEDRKGGFPPDELRESLPELRGLQHVLIRGLMVIPPVGSEEESRVWFGRARSLRDQLVEPGEEWGLSMGMSGDFEAAIEEGATVIRVGSAIFGDRATI